MTLRVEISIVPFGNEKAIKPIHVFNISNISFREGSPLGNEFDHYVVEVDDYKNYNKDNLRVSHKRDEGAIQLAAQALKSYLLEKRERSDHD